jgi:hypothetical protein
MERRAINPWQWQDDNFGYAQAIEVTRGQRVLYCAGQTSMNAYGPPQYVGEMDGWRPPDAFRVVRSSA